MTSIITSGSDNTEWSTEVVMKRHKNSVHIRSESVKKTKSRTHLYQTIRGHVRWHHKIRVRISFFCKFEISRHLMNPLILISNMCSSSLLFTWRRRTTLTSAQSENNRSFDSPNFRTNITDVSRGHTILLQTMSPRLRKQVFVIENFTSLDEVPQRWIWRKGVGLESDT